jgi:putative transposase
MRQIYRRNSFIVFVDETGFMMEPLVRRTWARRGHTPVLTIPDEPHDRISVIGAMTIRLNPRKFGFLFHLSPDNVNFRGDSVAKFLAHLHSNLSGHITLLWDSIHIHRAEPVSNYLVAHPTISVEMLPPYAPELNPVDNIWSYVKYGRLSNFCPHDLAELRKHVKAELFRVQKMPDLLESLFLHTGLTLDL